MIYYLVQNKYGKQKRMIHKEGCGYLKHIRQTYLHSLGDEKTVEEAVAKIENRNFPIVFCSKCCNQKEEIEYEVCFDEKDMETAIEIID
jgi:recombinational DNA repair protein RecR